MSDAEQKPLSRTARRTRQALIDAAAELMRGGTQPTLEEVAETALVSRATAYRYFTGVEPLLVEAALEVAMPLASMFEGDRSTDPLDRALRVNAAVDDMMARNEAALRALLVHSLQRDDAALPVRQNRRTPLIEAALAPARGHVGADRFDRLTKALALVIGTEAMIVCKDVLRIDEREAGAIKAWMIQVLIEAALAER